MKVMLQAEAGECGLACLAMVSARLGRHLSLAELRQRFRVSVKGATLAQLARHAAELRLRARPVRLELEDLPDLALPAILHWDLNHFVVLHAVRRDWRGRVTLTVLDPALGQRRLSLEAASPHFTGIALELAAAADFEAGGHPPRASWRELLGQAPVFRRAIVQLGILAIALEIFALVAPLFNQYLVDELQDGVDPGVLTLLACGFAGVIATQSLIHWARSGLLIRWSAELGYRWTHKLHAHLIRLRASFFETRPLGDLASRFGSATALEAALASLLVESVIDGMMALLAMAMLAWYSPAFCAVAAASAALYAGLRLLSYPRLQDAALHRLYAGAKEHGHFLETVRAISAVKLFGREAARLADWSRLKRAQIGSEQRAQRLSALCKLANVTLLRAQALALLYVGALQVLERRLSIGMLMAASLYAGTFSGRVFQLLDSWVDIRLLGLHAGRLADLLGEPPEVDDAEAAQTAPAQGRLSLRGVSFRYGEGEPWVLRDVSLDIPPGQSVALTGPSGGGKTTLAKILLGLLQPQSGEVLVDGVPIARLGPGRHRALIGTVLQEDALLSGSLLGNISFFDETVDYARVAACARQVGMHEDILAMPMGYHTLVGEQGAGLSGGQRQRLLLARALYKRPSILLLDEATSHLDIGNERAIGEVLARLRLTRVMVAHRPETIATAERVLVLADGRVDEAPGGRAPAAAELFTECF
ncbi:peptidase domain-containing ABC transporter [Chromobacterium violaceum]|nr:peptidase domain-containing ABC transporter [Chromobacterium violaceum]